MAVDSWYADGSKAHRLSRLPTWPFICSKKESLQTSNAVCLRSSTIHWPWQMSNILLISCRAWVKLSILIHYTFTYTLLLHWNCTNTIKGATNNTSLSSVQLQLPTLMLAWVSCRNKLHLASGEPLAWLVLSLASSCISLKEQWNVLDPTSIHHCQSSLYSWFW